MVPAPVFIPRHPPLYPPGSAQVQPPSAAHATDARKTRATLVCTREQRARRGAGEGGQELVILAVVEGVPLRRSAIPPRETDRITVNRYALQVDAHLGGHG